MLGRPVAEEETPDRPQSRRRTSRRRHWCRRDPKPSRRSRIHRRCRQLPTLRSTQTSRGRLTRHRARFGTATG
jgi:hypothetical protein